MNAGENSVRMQVPEACRPEPQTQDFAKEWWMPRHVQKKKAAGGQPVDLLFIGDSITHNWETKGRPVWKQYYAGRNAFNLGFGGDRTQQVLWRIEDGALAGMDAAQTVLMIGTNNAGHSQDPPEETTAGVRRVLDELLRRMPSTRILLLAIFPRGKNASDPLRCLNEAVNEQIAAFGEAESIDFMNINDRLMNADGSLCEAVFPDFLHPELEGYRLWAEAIHPWIETV